jgi:two-component system nitrogen regulation response regulator GlnG
MPHVLIVDDEPAICWAFREALHDDGCSVDVAGSAEQAMELTQRQAPDVIVMDIRLPGRDGLEALRELRTMSAGTPVIIMTAFGSLNTAVRAIEGGAFDYLTKPVDLDKAVAAVRQALQSADRSRGCALSSHDPESFRPAAGDVLIGRSRAMQDVFRNIALVAEHDVPVLITGESGTGKDLVARAIHEHSRRRGDLVPVCIPALSESVVESELFGHMRGAFTGADADRRGLLELANHGTAFFDEIGDVPLNVQAKLLRTLESGEFRPVGGSAIRKASFRLIAATHQLLEQRVAAGEFRADLYYRLNVFRIELPALRERPEDIPELAAHLLRQAAGTRYQLSDDALAELQRRPWNGNVRELRNALEHAAVICRGDRITPEHLPAPAHDASQPQTVSHPTDLRSATRAWAVAALAESDSTPLYERFLRTAEPELLHTVLQQSRGNRATAARRLGLHRETLREKLRKFSGEDCSGPGG